MLVPAALGVFGLRRPTALMALAYLGIYATGLIGVAVAHRFLAPAVLTLQIGLVELMLTQRRRWPLFVAAAMPCLALHWTTLSAELDVERTLLARHGNFLVEGRALLRDRPVGIAADRAAAWPVVANGMKVYTTPFTETLIPDQPVRWRINPRLFAATVTPADRLALACRLGVHTLVADRDTLAAPAQRALAAQAVRTTRAGPLLRYDLPPCPQRGGATLSSFPSASSVSR